MNITKPTLFVDLQKCKLNLQRMLDKANSKKVDLRPHFKTHQSIQIGEIFKEFGLKKITVSSVEMAQKFAENGWQDITIAFPFNPLEIKIVEQLSDKVELNILISSQISAQKLKSITRQKLNYFIEIDTGYHRSGILAEDFKQIARAIKLLSAHQFIGFLTHSGHTYQAGSIQEILEIHRDTIDKMKILKQQFASEFPHLTLSIGDTPSCTLAENFESVDEMRPGNFVFYDLLQLNLGVCKLEDIAVCLACPVVDINRDRNEIVIYGGAVHLSKEHILHNSKEIFGQVVKLTDTNWYKLDEDIFVISLSQEHGIIKASDELIHTIKIGDVLGIIPVHSCLTMNLNKNFKFKST